jgi:hypothetical protein
MPFLLSPACLLSSGVEIAVGGGRTYLTRPCHAAKLEEPPRLPPRATPVPGLRRESADGTEQLVHTSWVSLTLTEGKFRQVRLIPPASCLLPNAQRTQRSLRRVRPSGRAVLHVTDSRPTGSALFTQVRKMPALLTMAILTVAGAQDDARSRPPHTPPRQSPRGAAWSNDLRIGSARARLLHLLRAPHGRSGRLDTPGERARPPTGRPAAASAALAVSLHAALRWATLCSGISGPESWRPGTRAVGWCVGRTPLLKIREAAQR